MLLQIRPKTISVIGGHSIACGRKMSTECTQATHVTSALNSGKEASPTEHKLPPGPGGGIQKYGHPANGSAAVRPISPLTWHGSQ